MIIANDFEDINFLNDDSLEDSKKILKKLFLIDFDSNDWFNQSFLLDVADSRDLYDSTYDKKSLNDWLKAIYENDGAECNIQYQLNYCLDKLHRATMSILKNYTFELQEYFPISYKDSQYYHRELEKYLLDDMKLKLCVIKSFYVEDKKYVSLNDAFNEYIKFNKHFKDIKIREYILNGIDIDSQTLNNKRRKYRENLKSLKERSSIYDIDTKFFYKKDIKNEQINEIAKHILLYTLDKWNDFGENEKEPKRIDYKDIESFFCDFLDLDITTTDIFLFEKMYEIYYKIGMFLICFMTFYDSLNLPIQYMKELIAIVQLPNLVAGFDVANIIMQEYINIFGSNSYNEFGQEMKIYEHVSCYLIPLYNMVFANILSIYCNANGMKIENFLKIRFEDGDILKDYRNKCNFLSQKIRNININKLRKQEIQRNKNTNDIDLIELISLINSDTEKLKKYKNNIRCILEDIEKCDLKLLDIVQDRESYQKNLKQLILNGIISKSRI